jgi:beta-N-acetylhexosaminidase
MGMTAHVVFTSLDRELPATTSATIISQVIRGFIGFDVLLMSDDLSMGALSGSLAERTRAALGAGCDMALHCNGDLAEMQAVAGAAGELAGASARRADAALAARAAPKPLDLAAARAEFARTMDGAQRAGTVAS